MAALPLLLVLLQSAPAPAAPPPGPVTVLGQEAPKSEPELSTRIARDGPDDLVPDATGAMVLREWANCIVRTRRADAVALLGTPLNSPAQQELLAAMTETRFGWRTPCLRARMMRIDNLMLRGALGEALHRWEARRKRNAGALQPPALPDQPPEPGPAARAAALARLGQCVTRADPQGVADLIAMQPNSRGSDSALERLKPHFATCRSAAIRGELHPMMLRGVLGEPFYLQSRGLLGPEAREATASTP